MELRVIFSLIFSALAFFAIGSFAYYKPACFGGNFKIVRTNKFFAIKHNVSANDFVIRNTKKIGLGIVIAGVLEAAFAAVYLFYPGILLVFSYV